MRSVIVCVKLSKKQHALIYEELFEPGMHNLFDASEIVIDAILDGTLSV